MTDCSPRPARHDDLARIVAIHQAAFPGFFLTALGPRFLYAYYRRVLDDPAGVLLVAEGGGGLAGFVAGYLEPASFYRGLRRLAWPLALSLLRRPWLAFHAAGRARSVGGSHTSGAAELASLAVDPAVEGRGIGSRLVHAFLDAAARGGARHVTLTTDARANDAVNAFYRKLGFRLARTFESTGQRAMHEYTRELTPVVPSLAGPG
jgi:ribosomal protein S18 acetylase RimI-like enzyme